MNKEIKALTDKRNDGEKPVLGFGCEIIANYQGQHSERGKLTVVSYSGKYDNQINTDIGYIGSPEWANVKILGTPIDIIDIMRMLANTIEGDEPLPSFLDYFGYLYIHKRDYTDGVTEVIKTGILLDLSKKLIKDQSPEVQKALVELIIK